MRWDDVAAMRICGSWIGIHDGGSGGGDLV
jgi:hypothetical protein